MSEDKVILVVEDEQPLLEAIRLKLDKNNFKVVTARSVEQAKQYVIDLAQVDAIWLDHYLLGKEDGLDFVAWCKEGDNAKCKNIPVFVVSNTASHDKVASYLQLGIKEYFVKSNYRLDEIIATIIECLEGKIDCPK
ncbi:MAG: response regulator [Candidatus Vogelbacteria bacterium]|nr:response regulator [Candidatus Vogelbacteria bacterium]